MAVRLSGVREKTGMWPATKVRRPFPAAAAKVSLNQRQDATVPNVYINTNRNRLQPEIAPGFSNAAPPPSPGMITGPAFVSGALPLDATEAGGAGLSPMIAVPDPAISATSCNGGSMMMASPSLPVETPGQPTLFNNAGATGSSPYGC